MKAMKKAMTTSTLIGLGAAVAVGTVIGVKKVADKHKTELGNTKTHQKMTELLDKAKETGTGVAATVKEDITTVIDTVKTEAATVAKKIKSDEDAPDDTAEAKEDETPDLPKPVKTEDVVARTKEAETVVENVKNGKLKDTADKKSSEEKKPAPPKVEDHAAGIAPAADTEAVKKANAKPVKATTARETPVQKDKNN